MATVEQKRAGAVAHCAFVIAHGPTSIGYQFGGGTDLLDQSMAGMERIFRTGRLWTPDCSRTVNWITRWSGWKPFGRYGFLASSDEMAEVLPHYDNIQDAHPGALVVCVGGPGHVFMVMQPDGDNPWCMSHGTAFSTNHVRYQDEVAYHRSIGQQIVLLSVLPLIN